MNGILIHPSAYVSEQSQIGQNTKIWMNSQIRENSYIGSNCVIGKDTYIDSEVTIGNNVKVQNGVSIFKGVYIDDDVFIGPMVTFTNDLVPRSFNINWEITNTYVEKGASIGANATIICGNTLGEYCMIGAGSVVTHDVPPYTLVVGNPAQIVCKICKCGGKIINNICEHCSSEKG